MKEEIKNSIHTIYEEIEKEEQRHKQIINSLNIVRRSIQKLCDHSETKYYPDASGNNDSCYVCQICGLEKKRF